MVCTHPKYMILGNHWLINLICPGTIAFCTPTKQVLYSGAMIQTVNVVFMCSPFIQTAGYDLYLNPSRHENDLDGPLSGVSDASSETAICDSSHLSRKGFEQKYTLSYAFSTGDTNPFWAGDLMHRLFHIPAVTEDVGHYADDYDTSLELAKKKKKKKNATFSVRNSDSLQYFALDA